MSIKQKLRDSGNALLGTILVLICALIFVGGITAFHYQVLPWQLEQQREANTSSQQYVTTKQEQMLRLVEDVRELETEIADLKADDPEANRAQIETREVQIEANLEEILRTAGTIDESEVPQSVLQLLAEHNMSL